MSKSGPGGPTNSSDGGDNSSLVECPTCGKGSFDSRGNMKIHHKLAHGESLGRGVEVECDICGDETRKTKYDIENSENDYCSNECRSKGRRNRVVVQCPECGEENEVIESYYEKYDKIHCDNECRKDSEIVECDWCGNDTIKHGYQLERSGRLFCSTKCHGKWKSENIRGENSPSWKGGYETYYGPNWPTKRRKARKRDQHRCQICNDDVRDFPIEPDVHHIRPIKWYKENYDSPKWWEEGNDLSNLITMCRDCHHSWEGIPLRPQRI